MTDPAIVPFAHRGERGERYRKARAGFLPAEALPTHLRRDLVAELVAAGLTDVQIAERTAMTTYTAARIREGIGLQPNRPRTEGRTA